MVKYRELITVVTTKKVKHHELGPACLLNKTAIFYNSKKKILKNTLQPLCTATETFMYTLNKQTNY